MGWYGVGGIAIPFGRARIVPRSLSPRRGSQAFVSPAVSVNLDVGHWHNDMPGLTAECMVLATSEKCPRQIVEYGPVVYGV